MNHLGLRRAFPSIAILTTVVLVASGCGKGGRAPETLKAEEVQPAIQKAFAEAPADVRASATEAVAAMHANDLEKAMTDLQQLSARPELTREQRLAASRSWMALQERLAAAAAAGDSNAQAALDHYRATK